MKIALIFTLIVMLSLNVYSQVDTAIIKIEHVEGDVSNPIKIKPYIMPVLFVSYGLISLGNNAARDLDLSMQAQLRKDHPKFATHIDDYIQFSPLLAMYLLDIAGVKGRNKVLDQTAMVFITTGIATAVITTLKKQTHRLRPGKSSYNSFPSGHTATAFAAAELLNQEFKGSSPWYGYAGYSIATATGILRMYNNKHWFSDVVAGAGLGILSTKLTYLVYPYLKKMMGSRHANTTIMPSYQNGALQLYLNSKF